MEAQPISEGLGTDSLLSFLFTDFLTEWKQVCDKHDSTIQGTALKASSSDQSDLERAIAQEKEKQEKKSIDKQKKLITQSIEQLLAKKEFDKKQVEEEQSQVYLKKETETELKGYTIAVKYTDNGSTEEFTLSIIPDQYQADESGNEEEPYSVTFTKDKKPGDPIQPISILYERKGNQETALIQYHTEPSEYMVNHVERRENFSESTMHMKHLHVLSAPTMPGVYGFTYLGSNFMARRDDLSGDFAHRVDTHEAIHTPDEYETRRIEDWHFEPVKMQYKLPMLQAK